MIKIAICADEIDAAGELEKVLFKIATENGAEPETDIFYDAGALEERLLSGKKYDLLFLDISTGQKGLAAVRNIRKADKNGFIISLSGDDNCPPELLEAGIFDFIRKPVDEARLRDCFLRAHDRVCGLACHLEFHYRNERIQVAVQEILYFESKGRKIQINLFNGTVKAFNGKLDEVQEEIKNSNIKIPFLRIHQSYLVNFYYVRGISKMRVRLFNNVVLPVSAVRQKEIWARYGKLFRTEEGEEYHS